MYVLPQDTTTDKLQVTTETESQQDRAYAQGGFIDESPDPAESVVLRRVSSRDDHSASQQDWKQRPFREPRNSLEHKNQSPVMQASPSVVPMCHRCTLCLRHIVLVFLPR